MKQGITFGAVGNNKNRGNSRMGGKPKEPNIGWDGFYSQNQNLVK